MNTHVDATTILMVQSDTASTSSVLTTLHQQDTQVVMLDFRASLALQRENLHPYHLVLITASDASSEAGHVSTALMVCRHLRALCDLPLLVISECRDEQYQMAAYAAGADDYIVAPVSGRMLTAKLMVWRQLVHLTQCR